MLAWRRNGAIAIQQSWKDTSEVYGTWKVNRGEENGLRGFTGRRAGDMTAWLGLRVVRAAYLRIGTAESSASYVLVWKFDQLRWTTFKHSLLGCLLATQTV